MKMNEILISHCWEVGKSNRETLRWFHGIITGCCCVAPPYLVWPLHFSSLFLVRQRARDRHHVSRRRQMDRRHCPRRPCMRRRSTTTTRTSRCRPINSSRSRIADGKTVWSIECPMTAAPAAGDGLVFAGQRRPDRSSRQSGRPRPVAAAGRGTRHVALLGHRLAARDRRNPAHCWPCAPSTAK